MSIKEKFKAIRNNYIINQVKKAILPNFEESNVVRKKFVFSGRVQKVGFRMELDLMAKRLGLIGWVKNTPQGNVEAEIQGEIDRIDFLVKFMKSLKRIKITNIKEEIIDKVYDEEEFIVIK